LIVINLFSGPGIGKSTVASGLFYHAKRQGTNVELVTEYAKDMVWEERTNILKDQLYMLAKQNRRLSRLEGRVDYVITDSPLLLCAYYAVKGYYPSFAAIVREVFDSYANINLILDPAASHSYSPIGRTQTTEEAIQVDIELKNMITNDESLDVRFITADDRPEAIWRIIKEEELHAVGKR
jgi:hypothetical protein